MGKRTFLILNLSSTNLFHSPSILLQEETVEQLFPFYHFCGKITSHNFKILYQVFPSVRSCIKCFHQSYPLQSWQVLLSSVVPVIEDISDL